MSSATRAGGAFLVEEQEITAKGESAPLAVSSLGGGRLTLTFGILEADEQQSIDLQVVGSADGETWQEQALLEFPQKFYPGTAAMVLDLASQPEVSHLKAVWTVNRWGRGTLTPRFRVYVFVQPG